MVHFGTYISSCQVSKYEDKYVQYEILKTLLSDVRLNKLHSADNFYKALEENWLNCRNFAESWVIRLESRGIADWQPSDISEVLELNQFVFVNQEALRKIIKKHDKNLPQNRLYTIWRWKMDFQLTQRIIDLVLNVISKRSPAQTERRDPFQDILGTSDVSLDESSALLEKDDHEDDDHAVVGGGGAAGEIAPQLVKQTDTFVRQSTKYWVKTCDLAAVCTTLIEHLNVHSFAGKSPWTPVSSVYLDNKDRRCYTERLNKDEGARVVRLRTYDNDTSRIWVERKVHHEQWTREESAKERFPISEGQVMSLLRGQTLSLAEKHKGLADEIQTMINEFQLYPTLRVDYLRLAFQPPDHDHVRVSVDLNMRYVNEKTTHMDWRTGDESLSASDELIFPYSVVEIKLREPFISNPPEWLSQLESSSLLHKENSFSKYMHGTYEFYLQHQLYGSSEIKTLKKPIWYDNISFTTPQLPVVSIEDIAKAKAYIQKKQKREQDQRHWFAKLFRFDTNVDEQGRPVRVEPKTFFANERTFLTWFNCSIFVCSIGVAIVSTTHETKVVGGLLISIGLIISVYAMMTYTQRTFSLLNKRAQGYADRFGPIILGVSIMCIYIVCYLVAVVSGVNATNGR